MMYQITNLLFRRWFRMSVCFITFISAVIGCLMLKDFGPTERWTFRGAWIIANSVSLGVYWYLYGVYHGNSVSQETE